MPFEGISRHKYLLKSKNLSRKCKRLPWKDGLVLIKTWKVKFHPVQAIWIGKQYPKRIIRTMQSNIHLNLEIQPKGL